MKHFYMFIVLDADEAKQDCPVSDFEYDDYRHWGLYDMDAKKLVFFGDNIHNNGIEDEIDAFLRGITYAGGKYSCETGYIIMNGAVIIQGTEVLEKLNNGEMIDEVL